MGADQLSWAEGQQRESNLASFKNMRAFWPKPKVKKLPRPAHMRFEEWQMQVAIRSLEKQEMEQ